MRDVTFDELAALPILRQYERSFRKATGVSLGLLPPDEQMRRARLRQSENPFCAFVANTPAGCAACLKTQRRIAQSTARELASQQVYCAAGLTDIAIPVMVGGRHVATLLSGQIFRRKPTERDFDSMLKNIGAGHDKKWIKKARKAYFDTPVILKDTLQAVIDLLEVFARHLADDIVRQDLAPVPETEPKAVSGAKRFVEAHFHEPLALEHVLEHVHVSRFYFCKIFKKSTGITFTEYVARVRVEKAKALLRNPSLRVSEAVFVAGFGSIPQFNSVFRRLVGLSPTEYRASLRDGSKQHQSPMPDRAANRFSSKNGGIPAGDETALPGNIIRATAFQPDAPPVLPPNIIRPCLTHHSRRAARA